MRINREINQNQSLAFGSDVKVAKRGATHVPLNTESLKTHFAQDVPEEDWITFQQQIDTFIDSVKDRKRPDVLIIKKTGRSVPNVIVKSLGAVGLGEEAGASIQPLATLAERLSSIVAEKLFPKSDSFLR